MRGVARITRPRGPRARAVAAGGDRQVAHGLSERRSPRSRRRMASHHCHGCPCITLVCEFGPASTPIFRSRSLVTRAFLPPIRGNKGVAQPEARSRCIGGDDREPSRRWRMRRSQSANWRTENAGLSHRWLGLGGGMTAWFVPTGTGRSPWRPGGGPHARYPSAPRIAKGRGAPSDGSAIGRKAQVTRLRIAWLALVGATGAC